MINDLDIDAIYFATPPSSHKEYTLAAARAGKAVYVEKPMAISYAECLEMIVACDTAGVPLYTAYYRRALPRFLKIKFLLDDGEIGVVRYVSVVLNQVPKKVDLNGIDHWRIDPKMSGGGYFYELCCHMLDLLLFYFCSIRSVVGHHSNQANLYHADDMVSAAFLDEPIILKKNNDRQEIFIENPLHVQQPLIQMVVDELLGQGRCPSTGYSGAQTNWVMDRILGRTESMVQRRDA